jgi:MarR family transcriptional regulator for hemolysin
MSGILDIWLHAHNMIRSARQIINHNLRPLGLSSAEGNILLHMWLHGQEMEQERLAEQLDISKPAVSRTLNSLEKKGYVSRQPAPDDRRVQRVFLTGKTLAIGPQLEHAYNQIFALAVQGISPAELEEFTRLFRRMSENFAGSQASSEAGTEHSS